MALMAQTTRIQDAWEQVQLARHPQRPHTRDYIGGLCSEFVELRGDRGSGDDCAIVGGVGRTRLGSVIILGHQKGRDNEENALHHFGMPSPEGFRKAERLMRHAERFGMPLICLLDTPGARVDRHAEEHGQLAAIGQTLLTMARLRVPIVAVVIGEAAAGGALALALADRFLMLEHSFFAAASPEASALQLWQDASLAPEAARSMKITAQEVYAAGLVDEIVPEPLDGAHTDHKTAVQTTTGAILRQLEALQSRSIEHVLWQRYARYRAIGRTYERELELNALAYGGAITSQVEARATTEAHVR